MESPGKMPYALKYGLLLGILGVIFSLISNMSGLTESPVGGMVSIPIMLFFYGLCFYLAFKAFRTDNDGMSLGQALGIGMLVTLISSIISSIFTFLYMTFIDPGMMERIQEVQIEALENSGMSDAQIEQQMEMMQMFSGPVAMVAFGLLGALCFGFFLSLIIGAIMKKEKAPTWLEGEAQNN